jgi:membrane protease subunit HflC
MNNSGILLIGGAVLAFILATQSLFTVDQRQQAIVLQLGQPQGETRGPGLHMKIPFIQSVTYFDRRVLSVDPPADQMVISSSSLIRAKSKAAVTDVKTETKPEIATDSAIVDEAPPIENVSGEPIIVDTFARYKIVDPLQFLKTLRNVAGANRRLETILNDATRGVLGQTSLKELLSEERTSVMSDIKARVNRNIKQDQLGIEIIDVRIVRADLTSDLRTSTVRRMISQLKERATETRAKGEERALEITSTAEKERTVIIAEAQRDAQKIKGQGDELAIKLYAEAFNKDAEFYSFIRSMEAYKNTLSDPETQLILSPDSQFFRHFSSGQ